MKHEQYKEMLELNVLGELTEEEEIELENHLFECDDCAEEYSRMKKFYAVVTTERPDTASDEDLLASRMRLFSEINRIDKKPSLSERFTNFIKSLFHSNYSFALGSAALIILGLFIGYLIFDRSEENLQLDRNQIVDLDNLEKGGIKISDVRLPDYFSADDQFEFLIGDTEPVSYKGDLNDLAVQRLLAEALVKTENPGFKIKTANTVAGIVNNNFIADSKIKEAFIHTLKNDENPGVRKSALKALINFPFDPEIRDALLYSLMNDDNASNRMDAINTLLAMNRDSIGIDEKTKEFLNNRISNEENELIKYRTSKLLLGGK